METSGMKVILASVILLAFGRISRVDAVCSTEQAEVTFNVTNKCCDTCPPGNGVLVECSLNNETQCQSCVSGKTYSSGPTYNSSCQTCKTCGNNLHFILHPCNVTHNTICGCPEGSYYDSMADQCKFCDLCPAGWGASRKCKNKQNTVCSPCESNKTFSAKLNYYSECAPCSTCSKTEVMLQACVVTEDTLCLSENVGRHPAYNYTKPTVYEKDDDHDGNIIPVYCSVLGLVVVGLLGYVIFKHCHRLRAKRRHKSPSSHEDVEYAKASGADSGVFVENDSPKNYKYCLASSVRDVPQTTRNELEKVLSVPELGSWKTLAKELGYNTKRISEFESRQRSDTNSCFQHMLHDWERRDKATVNHLIQCLRNIGRDDAARVLYLDSTEGRTQYCV